MASNVRFVDSLKVGAYQTEGSGGGSGSGITINNNVDNFILSATGNANIINGEANLQQQKMSEAQRIQQADVAGQSFVFDQTERREVSELNRVQSQIDGEAAAEAQARSDQMGAITGAIGGIGSMASSYMSGQAAMGSTAGSTIGSTIGSTNTGSNSSYTIGGSIYDKLPTTTNFNRYKQ